MSSDDDDDDHSDGVQRSNKYLGSHSTSYGHDSDGNDG
jgi:hypothetical protein